MHSKEIINMNELFNLINEVYNVEIYYCDVQLIYNHNKTTEKKNLNYFLLL